MVENCKLHVRLLLDDSEGADAMLAINRIRTLGDLRGQRIACEQGTTSGPAAVLRAAQGRRPL
jgi:ABC-type amino acid transport substrate-binding protein